MKLEKPKNENYAVIVAKLVNIIPLENCDNVVGTTLFGLQAIVSKDSQVGDIGLFIPAESQLSDKYCYENNLYRHDDKNKNLGEKGYIEDNRRVKAVKFRGNPSTCLFMPLKSVSWAGVDISLLREGDTFDSLNGNQICRKYFVERVGHIGGGVAKKEKFTRVESIYLPENPDTAHFLREVSHLDPNADVIVSQKIHGTSVRIGNTIVKRKLNLFEKIAKALGIRVEKTEYDYVYGSRKVVKDINNPNQNHYYKEHLWTRAGEKLKGLLPQGYLVYGELVGYTEGGAEIQRDYSYNIKAGENELYVYRVAFVNPQGYITTLTWDQMVEFCNNCGLKTVVELWRGKLKDIKLDDFLEKRFFEGGYRNALYLGGNMDLVDEGICIRIEKLEPVIYKAKSQIFLQHETKILDTGEENLEDNQEVSC